MPPVAPWIAERLQTLRWPQVARHAEVVQTLPLGPGNRLIVVEFGGQRILIGQSRAGLVRLGESAAT